MDFHKLISLRQSDRKYINKPVDREIINRCIEAARLAPSASNSQPWTFIVVDDEAFVTRGTFILTLAILTWSCTRNT